MSKKRSTEQEIQQQLIQIDQLALRQENLEREIATFFVDCQIDLEKLSAYVENEKNFNKEEWQQLVEHRKELDAKLKRDLSAIRDPKQAKRALASLNVQRHWLHVR